MTTGQQAITDPVEINFDGKPRQLKYGMGAIRRAEAAVGGFTGPLGLNILCTLLMFGLREDDPKITLDKLDGLLDKFLRSGGTMEEISDKVKLALDRAGVAWGKEKAEPDDDEGGAKEPAGG